MKLKKNIMKIYIVVFAMLMLVACGDDTFVPSGNNPTSYTDTNYNTTLSRYSYGTSNQTTTTTAPTEISTSLDGSSQNGTTKSLQITTTKKTSKQTTTTKKQTTTKKTSTTKKNTTTTTKRKTYPLVLPNQSQLSVIENEVIRLINVERQNLGIAPLTAEPLLITAARIRAEECKQASTFGHTRPDGSLWATIFEQVKYGEPIEQMVSDDGVHWYPKITYSIGPAGENLGSTDHSWDNTSDTFFDGYSCTTAQLKNTARKLFEGWKASSGHYRNMKNSEYKKVGVGLYVCKYRVNADGSLMDDYDCIQFIAITLFTSK